MRPLSVVRAAGLIAVVMETMACGSPGDIRAPFVIVGPTPQPETPAPAPTPPPGPPIRISVTDGWTNAPVPADTLSEFERRTLHMLRLRARPYPGGVSWPDTEF